MNSSGSVAGIWPLQHNSWKGKNTEALITGSAVLKQTYVIPFQPFSTS